jgi:hypothetical protein
VPPSEKTRFSCNIHDFLVQVRSPRHPGVLRLYASDAIFDVVIAGALGDTALQTSMQYAAAFFVPDINDASPDIFSEVQSRTEAIKVTSFTDILLTISNNLRIS